MYKQLFLPVIGLLFLFAAPAQTQPVRSIFFPHSVKSVQLHSGVDLQYVEQGDKTGIPVIFLHGFTDSWRSWELVLPHLPATVHAFALSQRGHGDSDKPLNGYTPTDFVKDVVDFMDAMKIKKAVIAGHSMGSVIAQKFAIDHADRTRGIVLVGSFAGFANNEAIQGFRQVLDTLNDPIEETFARGFQESTLAHPVPETFLHVVVQESLKVPSRVWKSIGYALFSSDYTNDLKKVTIPALIAWGDKDVFSPRKDQDALATTLPNARLLVYTGTGHALHWEEPEKFAHDLIAFIEPL